MPCRQLTFLLAAFAWTASVPFLEADSLRQTAHNNATVRDFGPTGTPWFHNAQGPGDFASYAISGFRFEAAPPDAPHFEVLPEVRIVYTQSNAFFTSSGPVRFFITFDPEIAEGAHAQLRHTGTGFGVDDAQFSDTPTAQPIGDFLYERRVSGQRDVYRLDIPPATAALLLAAINGGQPFAILLATDDGATAATYAGIENNNYPNEITLEIGDFKVAEYYAPAENLLGDPLREALADIIGGHSRVSYSWEPFFDLDADPDNPDNVILIYSGFSKPAQPTAIEWEREHLWPRSRGIGQSGTVFSDLFNLVPINPGVNNARGNLPFGYPDPLDPSYRPPGFYAEAPLASSDSRRWLPPENERGFIARAMFYMATRYRGEDDDPNLLLTENPPLSQPWEAWMGQLSALVEWNRQFPPSDAERARNNRIFEAYQFNRNPFIDYPDLVDAIHTSDTQLAPGTWRVSHFTFAELDDPTVSDWESDPDGDGIPNLLEYAFGMSPRDGGGGRPFEIEFRDGEAIVSFRKVRDAPEWNLTYTIETSSDLIEWSAPRPTVLEKTPDGAFHWNKRVAVPAVGTTFVRVRVGL